MNSHLKTGFKYSSSMRNSVVPDTQNGNQSTWYGQIKILQENDFGTFTFWGNFFHFLNEEFNGKLFGGIRYDLNWLENVYCKFISIQTTASFNEYITHTIIILNHAWNWFTTNLKMKRKTWPCQTSVCVIYWLVVFINIF